MLNRCSGSCCPLHLLLSRTSSLNQVDCGGRLLHHLWGIIFVLSGCGLLLLADASRVTDKQRIGSFCGLVVLCGGCVDDFALFATNPVHFLVF